MRRCIQMTTMRSEKTHPTATSEETLGNAPKQDRSRISK